MPNAVAPNRSVAQAMPLIRKFAVAIGIGLTMAALRFDILKQLEDVGANYWTDWTTRSLLVTLIAICTGLLVTAVLLENDRFLVSVSGFGAILLGFFLFVPIAIGPDHLGDLALGPKLAIVGSVLIVLGAFPAQELFSWHRSHGRSSRSLYVTWLAAAFGAGLVIVSLGRQVASAKISGPNSVGVTGELPRYWTSAAFSGRHSLGIIMLALAILVIALAVGAALLRVPLLGEWALAVSLLLLGLALYYPFSLSSVSALSIGGGLALEGAALATVASLAAVAVERGTASAKALNLRRLVAVLGIGLALAGTWTNLWGLPGTLWAEDGTLAGFPTILAILAGVLVLVSLAYQRKWLLPSVGVIGWIILGYFGYYLGWVVPKTGLLGPAAWLGAAGGALIALSAVSLYSRSSWRRHLSADAPKRLVPWLVTAAGTALALISLWLSTEPAQKSGKKLVHLSYWSSAGDHSLGIVMLVLGALTLVALLVVLATRYAPLHTLILATSLILLGITLFLPVSEAFNHLGSLRSGAWLALVGALVAAAGAVALARPDQLLEQAELEQTEEAAPAAHARAALKGKKHRVPEMRRGE
ncbi:MAG TPA: hypothetical protein VII83_03935 [Gaiellaceae bacterium]|jgi:hypothetical protein